MTAAVLIIAALLSAAIGVQVLYARSILRSGVEVGKATKAVWGVNIALLLALIAGLTWYVFAKGVS